MNRIYNTRKATFMLALLSLAVVSTYSACNATH